MCIILQMIQVGEPRGGPWAKPARHTELIA